MDEFEFNIPHEVRYKIITEMNGKDRVKECSNHAICHCPCHNNTKILHYITCCRKCGYCDQNVIFQGK